MIECVWGLIIMLIVLEMCGNAHVQTCLAAHPFNFRETRVTNQQHARLSRTHSQAYIPSREPYIPKRHSKDAHTHRVCVCVYVGR